MQKIIDFASIRVQSADPSIFGNKIKDLHAAGWLR